MEYEERGPVLRAVGMVVALVAMVWWTIVAVVYATLFASIVLLFGVSVVVAVFG